MFDRLTVYLSEQNEDLFHLTFMQLEEVLRSSLPGEARQADWWNWRPSEPLAQHRAIHDGGFIAKLSENGAYVQFSRHDTSKNERGYGRYWRGANGQTRRRTISAGAPADPRRRTDVCWG